MGDKGAAGRFPDSRLALFVASAPVSVAMFDTQMRYVAWSDEWLRMYELGSQDLAGVRHYDLFPWLKEHWREVHRRGLAGESSSCERDRLEMGDRRLWVRWRVVPVRDEDDAVIGITLFTEDITARVEAEEELRRMAERQEEITTTLGIGLFEHDFESGHIHVSDGWRNLLGLAPEQVPARTEDFVAQLRPRDLRAYHEARQRAMDPTGDGRFHYEVRPNVAGRERIMLVRSRVIFAGEGEARHPVRLLGFLVDQTDGHEMQEALSRAQRLETVGRMAGMVAHDFNNILTVILANLELAQLRVSDTGLGSLLRQAMEAAEMGAGFTKRLLALAGGHRVTTIPLSPDAHLSEVWEIFARVLGDEIVLHFEPRAGDAVITIDPAELDGALLNLIVNARDAQPGGGSIVVRSTVVELSAPEAAAYRGGKPGRFLKLSVIDKGTGMAEEVAARASEPFFTTKGTTRGTGLGLTSVTLTAERAGGFVHLVSAPGAGTEVAVFLPIAADTEPGAGARAAQGLRFGDGEMVLVVEDDAMVRETVLQRLEAIGYAVLEAGNAEAALDLLAQGEPVDLVFTDVVMPGALSGFDLVHRIQEEHPGVGVLMTSGHVSQAYRGHDPAEATVPILAKPYKLRELAEAVDGALRSAGRKS